jgi:hypothetical protein
MVFVSKLCILPSECICMFRTVLTVNSDCFPNSINRLDFVAELRNVFPVRYGLNSYTRILSTRYRVFNSRMEAGSNVSTAALRVVGGDEKVTQCLGI